MFYMLYITKAFICRVTSSLYTDHINWFIGSVYFILGDLFHELVAVTYTLLWSPPYIKICS